MCNNQNICLDVSYWLNDLLVLNLQETAEHVNFYLASLNNSSLLTSNSSVEIFLYVFTDIKVVFLLHPPFSIHLFCSYVDKLNIQEMLFAAYFSTSSVKAHFYSLCTGRMNQLTGNCLKLLLCCQTFRFPSPHKMLNGTVDVENGNLCKEMLLFFSLFYCIFSVNIHNRLWRF